MGGRCMMAISELMGESWARELMVSVPAADLLHGALRVDEAGRGVVRPSRLTRRQAQALTSVRAWHPGLFRSLATATAGITLELETDSSEVLVEVRMDPMPRGSQGVLDDVQKAGNLHEPADGLSATVDGRHLPMRVPEGDKGFVEFLLTDPSLTKGAGVRSLPGLGSTHHVRVYLPCLTGCVLGRVWGDGTFMRAVPARPRLLVLGDSIAQGYVAGDPALTWPMLLAERAGLDLVNQSIGGQVFQPGTVAGLLAALEPQEVEAAVVELGENYRYERCSRGEMARDVRMYLGEVRDALPMTRVWVCTPMWHDEDRYPSNPRSCFADVADVIRTEVARRDNMEVVEGSWLIDAKPSLMADAYEHPNATGSAMVAERLAFVMDALAASPEARSERAAGLLAEAPVEALPIAECVRRGIGEVICAEKGCVIVRLPESSVMAWAPDARLLERMLPALAPQCLVQLLGSSGVREASRALHLNRDDACHLVVWDKDQPPVIERGRDIRVLGEAYAGAVRAHYSHPEYLAEGEVEDLLRRGRILGAFEAGRLCGYIGEHVEGSMGMLEVFEGYRRRGWATVLESAKIAQLLSEGARPWAEVWPANEASLALQDKLGLVTYPAEGMHFLYRD